MNVCLLNDSFPPVIDGVANVVMNYAKIMQEEGLAEVCVGTPKYPDTDYSVYPYRVYPYHSFDTTRIVKGYRAGNPLDVMEIKEMCDFKPDIIHTHCPVISTYIARMIRHNVDAPVVFTYHTKFDEDIARAVKNEFVQKETVRVLVNNIEACDEVWVVSDGAGQNMKQLGYQGDYRVVSNGVDFAKGRVDQSLVVKATEEYDIPEGIPVFLFVGRIISYKGLPLIIDAVKGLSEKGIDFRMIFIGSGPDEEIIKNMAREAGLLDNSESGTPGKCIFTGPIYDRDTLRAWNTRADLFLFPSTYDTNGIVVREAAACGLASVLIKGSCAAEGITDDRNGFLIDQNAESLRDLLTRLCADMDHVHEVGMRAMDEIYISWQDSVHAANERYAEILELKASGKMELKTTTVSNLLEGISDGIYADVEKIYLKSSLKLDSMMDNAQQLTSQLQSSVQIVMKDMVDEFEEMRKHLIEGILK